MAASMWRQVVGQVHRSGSAVIEDRGHLRGAVTASDGNFWFSEVGAGVQALVLIGKKPEIVNYLINREDIGIRNTIEDLPEIYMAIGRYVPGERYRGLFPLHDALQALTEGIVAFAPGSTLTDLVGAFKDIRDSVQNINGGLMAKVYSSQSGKEKKWTGEWYIKFHYLQDRDKRMTLVAKKKLKFKQILEILSLEWGV